MLTSVFENVDVYIDTVVRAVERAEGKCDGDRLSAVVAYAGAAYSYYGTEHSCFVGGGRGECAALPECRRDEGLGECDGDDAVRGDAAGSRGRGDDAGVAADGPTCGERSACADQDRLHLGPRGGVSVGRGPNYERNRLNRERKKARGGNCRRGDVGLDPCPSLAGTVRTIDTRCAEELEAVRTLALRRTAENRVAAKLAEHRYASLCDATKTEALGRLDAQRVAMRINEAKAKSQASFKKCDESLKSLGSTGSAGEFALKKEVKRGEEALAENKVLQEQLSLAMRHLTGPVVQQIIDMDDLVPPKKSAHEVFGECPSDYDDDQRAAYYAELDSMDW